MANRHLSTFQNRVSRGGSCALVALFIAGSLSAACKAGESGPDGANRRGRGDAAAVHVETQPVHRVRVERRVDLSGTLVSPDQARVSSEVGGIVMEVPVQLGTEVRVGDTLIVIEPNELMLALQRAESALRQVEAQLGIDHARDKQPPPDDEIASVRQAAASRDDARAANQRAQQLSSRGLLAQVDRDAAETRLKVTEANYQAAVDTVRSLKASLQDRVASYELAQKKVNDAVVRAPVAGSVAERLVQPGEFIRENTPVATIVQVNPLKLKTAIQEKNAGVIRIGQPVDFTVEAFPGKAFHGQVAYVSPSVDQATRTFPVEVLVDNADRTLKPGFFAKGSVLTRVDDNVLAAPDDAVSTMAGVSTVYVIEDGKARQQIVTLGAPQEHLIEIVDGLKGPEVLATTNVNQLATGTKVRTGGADEDTSALAGEHRGAGRGRGEGAGR